MNEIKTVREHENRIEIDAPIEEVWKALTEADEIARWFAPKMKVSPGAGGYMVADWGPGLEWKIAIEVWEPNRHLRLVETRDHLLSPDPAQEKMEPCRLVQDYYLEGEGGKTILRLGHSGFGSSPGWDVEVEGTQGGGAACFLRLKQALERHRRSSVYNSLVPTLCYGVGHKQALLRIAATVPEPFDIALQGEYHLSGIHPELNGSILSISIQPSSMGSVAYVELALYALPEEKAVSIKDDWKARLAKLFPTQEARAL